MITYLIGAGASAQALPMIKDIPLAISSLLGLIKKSEYRLSNERKFSNGQSEYLCYQNLITDFDWLLEESSKHSSIDTYAKKLYLRNEHQRLHQLKVVLSIFFHLLENLKPYDKRYDSFFASICTNALKLPEHLRILSWNYDTQIETAFNQYSQSNSFERNQVLLNVRTKNGQRYENRNGFGIWKLNGSAALFSNKEVELRRFVDFKTPGFSVDMLRETVRKYQLLRDESGDWFPGISFAWEQDDAIVEAAVRNTIDTSHLIVIGYSFPFFNREVDRKLLQSMRQLEEIHYQTMEPTDVATDRVSAVFAGTQHNIKIKVHSDCTQFYLPAVL